MYANFDVKRIKVLAGGMVLGALALAGAATVGCDERSQAALSGALDKSGASSKLIPCCPSSERFKQNIAPLSDALATVERLQGVSFDYKPEFGGRRAVGFIAEDVATVLPEVIDRDQTGQPSRVEYAAIVPVTVEAIKELSATLSATRAENAELQARLTRLETMLKSRSE